MAKKKKKDDIKNTLLNVASTAKNIAIKSNSDSSNNAKNVSVARPTTTLNNATKKVLSTPKTTPKSTVKAPTSKAKSSPLPKVSSNTKIQQMAENSSQWNKLQTQKTAILKQNPKQNVSALTNKQNLLHKKNTNLGLDLGLKFTPSGSWTNSSGNKAYDVGTTKNGYISPVSPLALLTQLNSAMPKSTQQIAAEGQARQFNTINEQTKAHLDKSGVTAVANWLKDNTIAGVTSASSALTKTADLLLPNIPYLQDYFEWNANYADEQKAKANETNSKGGTASSIVGEIYQAGVQMIPSAIATIASGGSSTASQIGQAGSSVANLLQSPAYWTSFAQTAGPEYYNAKKNGANEIQASLTGMTSGAIGGAIERMGGIDTLLGNKTQGIIRTAAEEAGEEVLQDITSGLINKTAYDHDREWFGTGDSDAVINPQRLAMNAGAGAILGGTVSGVNAAINSRANVNNNIVTAKQAINNPNSAVVDVKVDGQSVDDIEIPTLRTVAENHINNTIKNAQNTQNTSMLSNQPLQNNSSVNVENMTSEKPLQAPTLRTVAENHINQNIENPGILKQGIWQEGEVKPKLKPEYEIRPETKLPMTPEEQNILEMQLDEFETANNILPLPGFNPQTQTFEQTKTVGQIIDNAIANAQNTKTTTDQTINSDTVSDTQENADVVNILSAWDTVREFDKQIADFEDRVHLTENDLNQIQAILLSGNIDNAKFADNPQDVLYLVELKSFRNAAYKPIAEYNQANSSSRNIQSMEWADYIAEYATDKSGLSYFFETPERNIYDIFGKNKHLAEQFIDTFITPVHKDVANGNKLMNDYRNRVKSLKLNKHESAIVQYMIENEVAGANKYITDNKIKMTKEKTEKIDNAVTEFRTIYKELLDKINTALIKNGYEPVQSLGDFYAPHFMEKLSDRKLARLLYQFGMKITKKDQLPTDLAGVTEQFRPSKKWFGNLEHRTGTKTVYDAVRGFDQYIETAADVITLTDSIQRLRTLEDAVRYRLSDEGTQMEIDAVKNDIQLNALQKREKIESIYSQEQTHIQKIKHLLSQKDAGMRNFVTDLRRYTDNLAGKKARGDRGIEDIIGREVYEISKQVQGRVAANMIAANPGSWLTNMIPLTQATGEIHTINLLSGMWDTIKAYMKNDNFVDTSAFLTNRRGSKRLVQSKTDKIGNALGSPMEFIDQFVSDSIVRAKTKENIQNGMDLDSAIDNADAFAASLMADRSKGAMPAAFNVQNPFVKPFTMFQLEVNNQLRYIGKDIPRRLGEQGGQAIAAALVNIFAGAYIYNNLYEKLTGRRAALDPVSMIKDTFNIIDDDEKENSEKIHDTFTTYAQQLPFIGGVLDGGRLPIGAVLPDFSNLLTVFNANVPTKKRVDIIASELSNPAAYLLLPFGGGAIKKGIEGVNMIKNNGAYRVNNEGEDELMFAAPGNGAADYLKAMFFGQYSNPNAQNYINSGFKVLSSDYTKMYKQLVNTYGIDNNTAYDSLMNIYTTQAKAGGTRKPAQRQALMNSNLPIEAKEHIDKFLFRSNSDENIVDYSDKAHFDITMSVKHKYLNNALYLHDDLGLDGDTTIKLLQNSMFGSTDNLGDKNEQIYTIIDNINKMNVSDDIKNYAFSEIVAPQISKKYASEQGKQLLSGIPMDLAMTSYYQRDIINEEIDNDNTISAADKEDYQKIAWQNYLDEYSSEFGLTFEQKENLRYFLANGQSDFEHDWNYYAIEGSKKEKENIDALRNCGLDTLTYQVIKSGISGFKADKDANGEPIDDSKKNKVSAYFKQWNLTDEQYVLMMKLQNYKVG